MHTLRTRLPVLLILLPVIAGPNDAQAQDPAAPPGFIPRLDPVKSDSVWMRNGDIYQGEIKSLERGLLELKTDGASTIYIKWPRVITVKTTKRFEIRLDDRTIFFGSIKSAGPHRVVLEGAADTLELPTQAVVELVRLKRNFWSRLDGNFDLGFNFTQQNSKVDINLNTEVRYTTEKNRYKVAFSGSFSRQDSVSDIQRRDLTAQYDRELRRAWFMTGDFGAAKNSQLGLQYSWSFGTGPGKVLVLSNRLKLTSFMALYYRREQYVGVDARNTVPLALVTDFQYFVWAGRTTDISSRLQVSPILNDSGRWQIQFTARFKRELFRDFYLNVQLNEYFDSNPPGDSNRNDLNLVTSIGWVF